MAETKSPATPIKRMDIKEFREQGYLQEVNRCFLHPLGLALEVMVAADGDEHLGGIWDYRDDPEGMNYGEPWWTEQRQDAERKRLRVANARLHKSLYRLGSLGYVVQPLA